MPSETNPWNPILAALKATINPRTYETWLRPTTFDHNGDHRLFIHVPNQDFADYFATRFKDEIEKKWMGEYHLAGPDVRELCFTIDEPDQAPASAPKLGEPKPKRTTCPAVPAAAWHGLAKCYCDLVQPTTAASDNFHFAGFMVAAGAALGKSVYLRGGGLDVTYPNMFVALVGRSSRAHKGTSIKLSMQLAKETSAAIGFTPAIASAQGVIKDFQRQREKQKSVVVACLAEMKHLIETGNSSGLGSLMPMLCQLYDSPSELSIPTKNEPIYLDDPPMFSLLAGCAPRWLEKLKSEDIESGIGNRVMFIAGEPRAFIADPPAVDQSAWHDLAQQLGDTAKFWQSRGPVQLRFSEEAKPVWNKYCQSFDRARINDPMIESMNDRAFLHVGKTALIYAALDRSEEILKKHLNAAIAYCDFLFASLVYIFGNFGASTWVKDEQRIIEIVQERGKITRRRLWQNHFKRTLSNQFLDKHLNFICGMPGDPDRPIWIYDSGPQGMKMLVPNPNWDTDEGDVTAPVGGSMGGGRPPPPSSPL